MRSAAISDPMRAALWVVFAVGLGFLAIVPIFLGMYPLFAFFAIEMGSAAAAVCGLMGIYEWRSARGRPT